MELLGAIIAIYFTGVIISLFVSIPLEYKKWKFAKWYYIFLYFTIPFIMLWDLFKFTNDYLNKKNLKQMNLRILGKAMSFMFLPTFGVLLMLLVGFFDPIAMWNFIKSDTGWAITIRLVIFIAEAVLVIVMYFIYLEEDTKAKLVAGLKDEVNLGVRQERSSHNSFSDLFQTREGKFYSYKTEITNLILIERVPDND